MHKLLQTIILAITCGCGSNVTFASNANLTTCPSGNFKVSHFALTAPYGYDALTKSMKILVVAEYVADNNQLLDFIIYPVGAASGDTLVDNVNALIAKLQPVSDSPLTYQINDEDGSNSVCAYSLPGDNTVTALLIAESGADEDVSSKDQHRAHIRDLFVNHLVQ